MDRENYDVINSVGENVDFLKLVERGRQIHDEAVFDLFARLMPSGVRFVKAHLVPSFIKKAGRITTRGHLPSTPIKL